MNRLFTLAVLFCCLLPYQANADEGADSIALEIRNLSTSVDRLTQLLYAQSQNKKQDEILRKLDVAVAYLNFRSRRIEMLERDKQNSQNMKTRLEDIIQQLENRAAQQEEDKTSDTAAGNTDDQARKETLAQLKMIKRRLTRVDQKLFDYDNQIIELRNQLDDVEGFVERHLEL